MTTGLPDPGEIARAIQSGRRARGLTQKELAAAAGVDPSLISLYERGHRIPTRKTLARLVPALGLTFPEFDRLRSAPLLLAAALPPAAGAGEAALLSREVLRAVSDAVLPALTDALRVPQTPEIQVAPSAADRATAPALWARLAAYEDLATRHLLIEGADEYRSWALVELLCDESARAAADDPARALELAELALYVAERALGGEPWRLCLQGYAWAFLANARRVGSDLLGAERAFARAWALWKAGAVASPRLLDASRLLDLEASLRRDQRRFPEALALLDRALAACHGPARTAHILLNRAFTYEQMGDSDGTVAALERAAPFVDGTREPRQLCVLRFNLAVALGHLGRYAEAAPLAAGARELAVALGNDRDLLRLRWLEARIAAGLPHRSGGGRLRGGRAKAIAELRAVCDAFAERGDSYNAALAALELAVLLLEEKRTAQARALAGEAGPIFESLNIQREALAAVRLFWQSVAQDTATAELGRRLLRFLERARHDPELRFDSGAL